MKRLSVVLLVVLCSMSLMADRHLYRYGWENLDDVSMPLLGEYRDGDVIESVDTATVLNGSQSLKLIDNDSYASDATYGEQAYICWINGLQDGDIIQGSLWRYNEGSTSGCRIAANYTDSSTGYVTYFSDGDQDDAGIGTTGVWEKVSYTWVYDQSDTSRTGMMVLARPYTNVGDVCYVDDLEIIVPDHVTSVIFPGTYDYFEIIQDTYDPNAIQHRGYGWEDGYADVLGAYGNVFDPTNTASPDPVNSGSRSLKVSEYPISGTPEVYVAFVTGLNDGDKVTAGFSAYDDTVGASPSVRIWAHSADANDINNYGASLSGNETYSGDEAAGWSRLEHEWVFTSSGNDAMVIKARLYSGSDVESQDFWIDDVNVIAPDTATIIFPEDWYKAADFTTSNCSWDAFTDPSAEQPVVLGTFGMVNAQLDQFTSSDADNRALLLTDAESDYTMSTLKQAMDRGYSVGYSGYTGAGYLAVVKGLTAGERVRADLQALSNSSDESAGVRMWAHYIYDENDIYSYAGSADGFDVYSDDTDWKKLAYTWYFDDAVYTDVDGIERTPVALVITGRPYAENGQGGYIDDLNVEAPVTATVEFPVPTNDPICVGGFPEYDYNLDCKVNLVDFAAFSEGWLGCNLQPDVCN